MALSTKRYIAGPIFILIFALGLPALIAGRLTWFVGDWTGTMYVTLFGLGTVAALTIWFDPSIQPADRKIELGHVLIVLGFLTSLAVSIYEHTRINPLTEWRGWSWLGMFLCLFGAALAFSSYYPRRLVTPGEDGKILLAEGIYRLLRFPAYTSLFLWGIGLALILPSVWGVITVMILLMIGVYSRILVEEARLLQTFGEEFRMYQEHTWRIIPFVY